MVVFVDDIFIYSQSKKDHEDHLRIFLQALREHQLYGKFSNWVFWLTKVRFLGHVVSASDVSMDLKNDWFVTCVGKKKLEPCVSGKRMIWFVTFVEKKKPEPDVSGCAFIVETIILSLE